MKTTRERKKNIHGRRVRSLLRKLFASVQTWGIVLIGLPPSGVVWPRRFSRTADWLLFSGSLPTAQTSEGNQACTELTAELRGELKEEGGDVVQHWNRKSELQQEEAFSHNVTLNLLTDSRHKNIISCKHCIWMFILKHCDCLLSLEIIENEIRGQILWGHFIARWTVQLNWSKCCHSRCVCHLIFSRTPRITSFYCSEVLVCLLMQEYVVELCNSAFLRVAFVQWTVKRFTNVASWKDGQSPLW